ncbi:E3 ubiquitin-protein ligase MARCHF3-like, partial [Ixodes scapularis]|uniref:E3 ubiquitin-protein ligase MARCHF3-like n=1 Tax=Ixodes scapularis TaxID=6945 RepID=UPI001A9E1E3D
MTVTAETAGSGSDVEDRRAADVLPEVLNGPPGERDSEARDCATLDSAVVQVSSPEEESVSLSSDGAPLCRICLLGDDKEPLLEPCDCKGTIGSVHRDCLERWIPRTADGKCQICQFQFTVCRQSKPIWWLLGDPKARRKVLGYLALGATFSASIALIFSLAWLYALRLSSRLGDRSAVLLVVLLAVQNVLWHYFPFLSFIWSTEA